MREPEMKEAVIKRLFESFAELEKSIYSAKRALATKGKAPASLLKRIDSYEKILRRQKALASKLCGHASGGNWSEVSKHVKLISGLSSMIRDDAGEVLASVRGEMGRSEKPKHSANYPV